MKIKIWGCRGSLPVSGPHMARYGGNTTCIEIRPEEGGVIIVDAGTGLSRLGRQLCEDNRETDLRFFMTHVHWDHIQGFPFFRPAYMKEYSLTFCKGPHGFGSMQEHITHQMQPPYFPVAASQLCADIRYICDKACSRECDCMHRGVGVHAFPVNHPNGAFGYRFTENGRTFFFIPDNELSFDHGTGAARDELAEIIKGADLLIHDAQYTEQEYRHTRGWGHSTFDDATGLAMAAGVKSFGIFHHDPDRTDDELDDQLAACRERVSSSGGSVSCFVVADDMEIVL